MLHIYDCSKVYRNRTFYRDYSYRYHDLSVVSGLSCYCDGENFNLMKAECSLEDGSISFIDSGNYHYISYFHLLNIKCDFRLVLMDNHPDAKEPNFPLLSCGGWVLDIIRENPHLKELLFIGVEPGLMEAAGDNLEKEGFRAEYYREESRRYLFTRKEQGDCLPVFLSIDKDVLSEKYAFTSWSQGSMSLEELVFEVTGILKTSSVLGIDVCGEEDYEDVSLEETRKNERANIELLQCFFRFMNKGKRTS